MLTDSEIFEIGMFDCYTCSFPCRLMMRKRLYSIPIIWGLKLAMNTRPLRLCISYGHSVMSPPLSNSLRLFWISNFMPQPAAKGARSIMYKIWAVPTVRPDRSR